MLKNLDFRDLTIRVLVIALTSLVLLFLTRDDNYDLHFKIRKMQNISAQLLLIEVPSSVPYQEVVDFLIEQSVESIFVSYFNYEKKSQKVLPFSINDHQPGYFNLELIRDRDGLVRKIKIIEDKIANKVVEPPLTINYRGPTGTFPIFNFLDLKNNKMNLGNKQVVLKSTSEEESFTTPIGLLPESVMVATFVDNMIENRFIPSKNFYIAFCILMLLLFLTSAFLLYLPSTLALVSAIAILITYISISLWTFDNFYFWTPVSIPVIQTFFTFLLISNYKFVLNERTRWELEKESLYFERVEEMKTNFLSLFSHDLKTPLAKIIGIVDTLESKTSDPEIKEKLDKINQASRDLEKYIKRILKMTQVQSKNVSLNKEPTDINTLINRSIEQNKFAASEKSITIKSELSPLFMTEIDASLIQEVINNFLENAITYSEQGKQVVIHSKEVNDYIKVSVKDQGRGIPKEAQDNIWEKYYRFDSQESGYGLGLFLSRYVINLHNGQVFLNSKVNEGSEFGFLLPISEE